MKITAARTDARTDTPDHSHFHQPSSHSYVASFGATRDTKNSYWKSSERRLTSPTDMSPTTSPGKLEGVYTYRLRNSGRALAIKANPNTPSIAPTSPRSTCDAPQRPALPEASTTLRPKIQNHSAPTFKNLISQGGAIAQDASPTLVSPARATPALLKPHCGQIAKHASPNMRTATRPSLRRSEHLPSSAPTSPRLSIYIGPINKKKRDETFGPPHSPWAHSTNISFWKIRFLPAISRRKTSFKTLLKYLKTFVGKYFEIINKTFVCK